VTHLIERFTEILKKGKYNSATIAAYRNAIFVFYNNFRDYPQNKFTDELISEYILGLSQKSNPQLAAQSGKAIILFFDKIYNRKLNIKATGKLKEEQNIEILSKEELKTLFSSIKNLKHRLLLSIIYNNGLKVTEAINLRIEDIDTENHTIKVDSDQPKKARLLRLSPFLNPAIEEYLSKYKPSEAFFPGSGGVGFYSARNIQLVFQKSLKGANIDKPAKLTTLRHSFAVHSLENGVAINVLQKILGHSNIQTTSFYMQFVNVKLANVKSPFEDIIE
jgi:integrase/recombinase XerD